MDNFRDPNANNGTGSNQESASVSYGNVIPTSVPDASSVRYKMPATATPASPMPFGTPNPVPVQQPIATPRPAFIPPQAAAPIASPPQVPRHNYDWKSIRKVAGFVGLGLLVIAAIFIVVLQIISRQNAASNTAASRFTTVEIPLNDLIGGGDFTLLGTRTLVVNGSLQANASLTISPSGQPSNAARGQIYYDQNNNQLAYYNGTRFVPVTDQTQTTQSVQSLGGQTGIITVGDGLTSAGGTISNSGVLSLQGQTGAVTLVAGAGIAVDGTTLSNTGVTSFGGATGDISIGNGLSLTEGTLNNSGIISAAAGSPNISVTNDGNGNITISSIGGGTGTVQSPGGTPGRIAKFTGVQTLEDSLISEGGATVTVNGNLSVTGSLALTNALTVGNGGTGTTALANNGVVIGQGAGALTAVTAANAGLCFISTAGAPEFAACPGAVGVASINGQTGAVTIANASAAGGTVTINDAGTSQKGIASFNSTNFTATSGAINTIQNIHVAATPTFGALALTSSQATSPMLLANNTNSSATGNLIDLQINGASRLAVSPAGNMTLSGTVNGQTISSAASFTGTLAVAGSANLSGGATVGGVLTANTITPSSAMTVGAGNQSLTLQGNAATTLSATSGANTTTLSFQAPTANVNYRLLTAAAGTYDICTTVGNCAGIGGGVTTPGGTPNRLAKFTGTQAIGDSIITDNGTTVTIGGVLAANTITPTAALTIGATTQNLALQGATTSLSATSGSTTNTMLFATPGGGNKTITLPNASGTVVVSASGPLAIDANGNITCPTCAISGSGVTSLNGLTGALSLSYATGAGSTITIQDASTSQKGVAQFNSTNFTASAGTINTIQNISTTSDPTFRNLALSTLNVTSSQATAAMALINNTNTGASGNLLDLQLNGVSRLSVSPAGAMTLSGTLNGQTISSAANFTGTLAVAGAASLNGGATVTGTLTANTITPTAAMTVGTGTQQLTLQGNSATTLSATSGANATTLAFQTPTANVTYRLLTAAAGTYDICTTAGNCAGVGGGVTTSGGTTNRLAKFTGSQSLGDSLLTDDGSTVTVGGVLSVNTITPSSSLVVGATGQNVTLQGAITQITSTNSGTTNTLTFATPAGGNKTITLPNASGTVAVSASGPLAIDANGNLTCPTCITSGGGSGGIGAVDSINGLTGTLTLANATGAGSTLTINDATTSQKGIAQFNATNFTATSGTINTIQDIATTAAPSFARLTVTSNQASNAMLLVNNTNASATGNLLDVQLNGASRLAVTPAGNMTLTGTVNGQTISSTASLTGTLAVAGLASLNGGATVTGTLTANTITPTGSMTVGSASQSLTLQGSAGTTITATSGASTTALTFQTPTANVSYRFATAAAGTYDVCTTAGNCSGAAVSLQNAYNNSTNPELTLDGTRGALTIRDNATPLGANLLEIQNNAGSTTYLGVSATGTTVTGGLTQTGGNFSSTSTGSASLTAGGNITITAGGGSTWSTSSGSLTVQAASTNSLILQTGGAGTVALGDQNTTTINIGRGSNIARTINIGNNGGSTTQAVTLGSTGGASSTVINAGTGNIALNSGGTIELQDATNITGDLDVSGALTAGTANAFQVTAAGGITAAGNAVLQGGTITLGTTSVAGAIVLNDGSTNTGSIQVAALGQNTVYTLPDPGAGTATICLSTGNCAGVGGTITGSGTNGTIAKFTGTGSIGDSLLSESAGSVTVNGNLNLTAGNQFRINGTQISSANLSNDANLAKLDASQTFTGDNNLTGSTTLGDGAADTLTIGAVLQGATPLTFEGGSADANELSLAIGTLTGDRTVTLGDESGTICLQSSTNCGFAATTGGNGYIQNQTAVAQLANFYIQSAAAATAPTAALRLASGQSGNLMEFQDTSGNIASRVDSLGFMHIDRAAATSDIVFTVKSTADTQSRLTISADGKLGWGSGSNAPDNFITRTVAGALEASNQFTVLGGLQVGAAGFLGKFTIQGGSTSTVSQVIRAVASQTADQIQLQDSAGNVNASFNSTGNQLTLGRVAASGTVTPGRLVMADGTTSNFSLTVQTATLTTNRTLTLPDESGTVCLQSSANCGFVVGAATSFIQNQNSSDQTANFRITGTARANTSVQTPLVDTATAVALALGTTNATAINLNQNTTIAATKTLTVTSGATSLTGATTGDALAVSNSTSTGNIAVFRDNATAVATIADGGAATFQNSTNSAGAFRVLNQGGGSLFNVDSTNGGSASLLGLTSGEVSSWVGTSQSLPAARYGGQVVYSNGYAYYIGGNNSTHVSQTTVYSAKVKSDGTLDTWTTSSNPLPSARTRASAVVMNGYVYVIGGSDASSVTNSTVYYAKLYADGTTSSWSSTTSLPSTRRTTSAVAANGYVYLFGGQDSSNVVNNTVYYAKANPDGTLGSWTASPNTLPQERYFSAAATANGYAYVMGGINTSGTGQTTVYYAKLNSNGTVGSWSTAANALPANRAESSALVMNGYMYMLGGTESGGYISTVNYAKLNADGSVGTWATAANSMSATSASSAAFTINGYMYAIGGFNGSALATVRHTNAARVQIGASLDLVGLQGQGLSDPGDGTTGSTGGSITAGNGTFVGSLNVQGLVSLNQGATINGGLNVLGATNIGGDLSLSSKLNDAQSFESATFVPTSPGTWTTGGNTAWSRSTAQFQDGIASAASGTIAHSQTSWLDLDYTFTQSGMLQFSWKVSSEADWDFLVVCVDNDAGCTTTSGYTYAISGEKDWQHVSIPVSAGAHSFRWLYGKDNGTVGGSDKAWVDNVRFTGGTGKVTGNYLTLESTTGMHIDTNGYNITIGESDGNAALLVLDDRTGTGDPDGINGAMYYSSFHDKFRCYENGEWLDCVNRPYIHRYYANAAQSITSGTDTKINFASVEQNDGDVSVATNNTFTLNKPGIWMINASVRFATGTGGTGERYLSIATCVPSGQPTPRYGQTTSHQGGSYSVSLNASGTARFADGAQVCIYGYQNSSGALNTDVNWNGVNVTFTWLGY